MLLFSLQDLPHPDHPHPEPQQQKKSQQNDQIQSLRSPQFIWHIRVRFCSENNRMRRGRQTVCEYSRLVIERERGTPGTGDLPPTSIIIAIKPVITAGKENKSRDSRARTRGPTGERHPLYVDRQRPLTVWQLERGGSAG